MPGKMGNALDVTKTSASGAAKVVRGGSMLASAPQKTTRLFDGAEPIASAPIGWIEGAGDAIAYKG